MNKLVKRESKFSYAEMHVLYNTKLELIKRDAAMLAKYKIGILNIEELESLKQEYFNTQDDPNMVYTQKEETFEKDLSEQELLKQMYFVKAAFENSFSKIHHSDLFLSLKNLSSKSNKNLSLNAEFVSHYLDKYSERLKLSGISQEFIVQFNVLRESFMDKLFFTELSRLNRTEQTRIRYEVENRVHNALKLICKTGRMIWMMENNKSLFNEYVLPVAYTKKRKVKLVKISS